MDNESLRKVGLDVLYFVINFAFCVKRGHIVYWPNQYLNPLKISPTKYIELFEPPSVRKIFKHLKTANFIFFFFYHLCKLEDSL